MEPKDIVKRMIDHTVDIEPLEMMVDALLADNQHINISIIPDSVERQLYLNCLLIIFRK